jgi:hypothetical protein
LTLRNFEGILNLLQIERPIERPLKNRPTHMNSERPSVRFLVSTVTVAGLVGVAQFFRGLYNTLNSPNSVEYVNIWL